MSLAALSLILPLLSAVIILLALRSRGHIAALLATGCAGFTFFLSITLLGKATDANELLYRWLSVGGLDLDIRLKSDTLSRGMMIVVTGIGTLVHLFSLAYMKDDAGKGRFFGGLSLFMFSMTGIVLAENLPMMFIFWELVGVSSYILIGHWYNKDSAADAAKKAFLTNRIGDFGFMIGILILWAITKEVSFDGIAGALAGWENTSLLTAATLLIFCGTIGKSAQFPLHVWLPDAMEGPTPVSALIHAATMVAAGVYMMVRVSFLIAASQTAGVCIAWIGGITALMAALMATQQNDIKRILAYSTLSQLGYMVMAVGLGAAQASMFHLFTHAWFKAGLFLGSGAIIYACHHEQDIWKMGGLKSKMPVTFLTFVLCTAALVAVPFVTSGWYSKEAILEAAYAQNKLLFLIAAGTALLTAFYMTRCVVVTFFGSARGEGADHAHEVGMFMKVPLMILAGLAVIAGFGFFAHGALGHYVPEHHGFGLVGVVSMLTLAIGAGFGWVSYHGKTEDPFKISIFANKFYFDEIYTKIVRYGQDLVASLLHFFDRFFVDEVAVKGGANLVAATGQLFRRIQTGNLQNYAFLFGLGVLLILFLALSH